MPELPQEKEQDGKLETMEWLAESPDLNPTELVWDEWERRVTSATEMGRTF